MQKLNQKLKNFLKITGIYALPLIMISCSDKKNEDIDLNGVWLGESQIKNQSTGEYRTEKVIYEFKGTEIVISKTKVKSDDLSEIDSIQTEQGIYKKVEDTLEIEVQASSCSLVDEETGDTVFKGKQNKKISYKLSENKTNLVISTLSQKLELTKLSEEESENIGVLISEANKGCYIAEEGKETFRLNFVRTIVPTQIKSDTSLDDKL